MPGAPRVRIHEILVDPDSARVLEAWAEEGVEVILLGREFAGAIIVTGAAPSSDDEETWAALRALEHGAVGLLGAPPREEAAGRLLPGDVLVDATAGAGRDRWAAQVLDWTGPAGECSRRAVPLLFTGTRGN